MIILIAGKKRAGKNYVANLLHNKIKDSIIVAFADELKKILATTLNITVEELNEYKAKEISLYINNNGNYKEITNFRKILQNFGTDAMQKAFGTTIWSDVILNNYSGNLIIPDFRFKHEYENLKHLKPFTVFVQGGESSDTHISEHDLDNFKFDFIIDNRNKTDISEQIELLIKRCGIF